MNMGVIGQEGKSNVALTDVSDRNLALLCPPDLGSDSLGAGTNQEISSHVPTPAEQLKSEVRDPLVLRHTVTSLADLKKAFHDATDLDSCGKRFKGCIFEMYFD